MATSTGLPLLALLLLGVAAAQSPPSLRGSADNATQAPAATERASALAEKGAATVDGFVAFWGTEAENSSEAPLTEGDLESLNVTSFASLLRAGSCAAYGCGGFHPGRGCQCNMNCGRYGNCCGDYQTKCRASRLASSSKAGKVLTLYHQTSREIAELILKSAFKVGTQGWCGGGIYFATDPAATETKAIGPDSHKGFLIEAKVDVGHVLQMNSTCDRQMSGTKLWAQHYDSIRFDPGDGEEYVVYESNRVVSMKAYSP